MADFTNQATLQYNGSILRSNVVNGSILQTAALTKTAAEASYAPGRTVTYVLAITNSGTGALNGLTLTDDLGTIEQQAQTLHALRYVEDSAKLFVNGVPQTAPTVTAGPPLQFTGISVPAGGSAVLVYVTELTEYAPLAVDAAITNTATLTGPALGEPITAQSTIRATEAALLEIVKELTPRTVQPDGEITYTFTVKNYGNVPAADTVVITDTFLPVLQGLTVQYEGAAWTPGTEYSYVQASGEFATLPGSITVPAASYTQDPDTGAWQTTPGQVVLTVTGTI